MTPFTKLMPALKLLNIGLALAGLALAAAGCASKSSSTDDASGNVDGGLTPNSPGLVYSKGWNELDIDANSAKNVVDSSGHYHTDHNMCQQAADGVYPIDTWNAFATMLNQVATSTPLPTPRCWDSPNGSKFYNHGLAELVLANGKQQLFEYKNAQICTTISDPALADGIMAQIEATLLLDDQADARNCPNYHPPGT